MIVASGIIAVSPRGYESIMDIFHTDSLETASIDALRRAAEKMPACLSYGKPLIMEVSYDFLDECLRKDGFTIAKL